MELILPNDFSDYEYEVANKGWFSEASLRIDGNRYRLNFYDVRRLKQEAEACLQQGVPFFLPNLIVLNRVTKRDMEQAVEKLKETLNMFSLVSESL